MPAARNPPLRVHRPRQVAASEVKQCPRHGRTHHVYTAVGSSAAVEFMSTNATHARRIRTAASGASASRGASFVGSSTTPPACGRTSQRSIRWSSRARSRGASRARARHSGATLSRAPNRQGSTQKKPQPSVNHRTARACDRQRSHRKAPRRSGATTVGRAPPTAHGQICSRRCRAPQQSSQEIHKDRQRAGAVRVLRPGCKVRRKAAYASGTGSIAWSAAVRLSSAGRRGDCGSSVFPARMLVREYRSGGRRAAENSRG